VVPSGNRTLWHQIHFFAFQGLIPALKSLKQLNRDCILSRNKNCEYFHERFFKTEEANKVVYESLVRIKQQRPIGTYRKSRKMV